VRHADTVDPLLQSDMHTLRPSPRLRRAALAGLALLLLAVGGDDPVPWPDGAPPADTALTEQIEQALHRHESRRSARYLEAWQPGVAAERYVVIQEDIDAGQWTLDELLGFGASFFEHDFAPSEGHGALGTAAPLRRVHKGQRGGPDGFSCAACHAQGGPAGAGTAPQTAFLAGDGDDIESALARSPPALLGLGTVQALAAEMTAELQGSRDQALFEAEAQGEPVKVELASKGVEFGVIEAQSDGTLDTTELAGIDDDLVVKPFGWKGETASLRRMIENEALIHLGIQSHVLALQHQADPDPDRLGSGSEWADPDDDGHERELEEGTLTAAAIYLALLDAPQIIPPHDPGLRDRWAAGSTLFDQLGCGDCHRRELRLLDPVWREYPDTTDGPPISVDLLTDGLPPTAGTRVQLFSDLRRHDMGPQLADPHEQPADAIPPDTFLTRPLWGLAESAPYLHDGRAPTIPEAIVAHEGEAQASRDAFAELTPQAQADLHVFLLSLSRAPRLQVPR
jgi:hypothetical protein